MESIQETILEETYRMEETMTRLSWVSKRHLADQLSQYQITPPQFTTLRCIACHGSGVSMSELADHCQAVMPTMTGIINRLVSRGLVERKQEPKDRRSVLIHLTQEGKALLEQINVHRRSELNQFLLTLTEHDRTLLINLMGRYLQKMETWINEE